MDPVGNILRKGDKVSWTLSHGVEKAVVEGTGFDENRGSEYAVINNTKWYPYEVKRVKMKKVK